MYVYLAVDVYTYDLLHIAIYERNNAYSTRAFLLALKAKGYQPKVIVTDLRSEYGPAIAEVFDQARHRECIFHALQWAHRQLKETYSVASIPWPVHAFSWPSLKRACSERSRRVYRFTPFTPDAQPRIRNKCPLELAGYDVASLPIAQICKGWALDWTSTPSQGVVPNV